MTAVAYAVPVLALLGCAAYALAAIRGPQPGRLRFWVRAARYHLQRHRYARRMRGPLPGRDQGIPYSRREWLAVLDAWEAPAARAERSRT